MQRYYGWYASRTRGARRRQASDAAEAPIAIVESVDWSLRAARFRWAELLRRIFEVDPLTCSRCQGLMRIVAVITEPAVITRILAHRVRARDPTPRVRSRKFLSLKTVNLPPGSYTIYVQMVGKPLFQNRLSNPAVWNHP